MVEWGRGISALCPDEGQEVGVELVGPAPEPLIVRISGAKSADRRDRRVEQFVRTWSR